MEHEVFVPVPAEALRATLTDPARVVRCVPGLQRDADAAAGPLAGRLKIRVGGHTITYRGALKVVERDGAITYEGQGAEARGKGTAELSLTVVLTPVGEGTSLGFTGALTAAGRLAEATDEARATAGARLLDKFVEALAALAQEPEKPEKPEKPEEPEEPKAGGAEAGDVKAGGPAAGDSGGSDSAGAGAGAGAGGGDGGGAGGGDDADRSGSLADSDGVSGPGSGSNSGSDSGSNAGSDSASGSDSESGSDSDSDSDHDGVDDGVEEPSRSSVFDAPVPPPSLDPLHDQDFGVTPVEFPAPQPPVEAAHARRTMIGRSAEEVDHAPPRGRYAPVPAPEATSATATLRWIAPAAALAIASAVVVGRALRRRR
ncbi:SRPBCC family protein [Streptomyces sp. NPDC015130]|uniref:SRPBCC family protein n=1 Tax=Streptomyces sp. NPDC015130 TaxID=3364940 RepID=UPI0036F94730